MGLHLLNARCYPEQITRETGKLSRHLRAGSTTRELVSIERSCRPITQLEPLVLSQITHSHFQNRRSRKC